MHRRAIIMVVALAASACAPPAPHRAASDNFANALRYQNIQSALSNGEVRSIRFSYCYANAGVCFGRYAMNVDLAGKAGITIVGPCQHQTNASATFDPQSLAPILQGLPLLAPRYPMPEMDDPHNEVDIVTRSQTFTSVGSYGGAANIVHARLDQLARDLHWAPPINFDTRARVCKHPARAARTVNAPLRGYTLRSAIYPSTAHHFPTV